MLSQAQIEKILCAALSKGGDFAEVYVEKSRSSGVGMINGSVENLFSGVDFGVGIRVLKNTRCVYVISNDLREEKLISLALEASASLGETSKAQPVIIQNRNISPGYAFKENPLSVSKKRKIDILRLASETAKNRHTSISQTVSSIQDAQKEVWIANSTGLHRSDTRTSVRFSISAVASSKEEKQIGYFGPGSGRGFEFIEDYPIEETSKDAADIAVRMLLASECPSGRMPVVINNGFGGVIFHEACGHALEATSVGIGSSVFAEKLGEKIAAPCVNAVDDGTLRGEWGSLLIDDEGMETKRNTLIENGILKGYLIDILGGRRMNMPPTGSARRQSYKYAPTSRMTNTFILPGKDKPEDIISDTPYGLYAAHMGGGSVDPATGEFNFSVNEAYMIRNGKIAEPVRGATLIGKGSEVLMDIDRVGDNLSLAQGVCGSVSGGVRVCIGQPMIRISGMTVGGK